MHNSLFKLTTPITLSSVKAFEAEHNFKPAKGNDLTSFGYAWGTIEEAPEITNTQALDQADPVLNGAFVTQGWVIRDKTEAELADEVQSRREGMVVERWQFATACMLAGIITATEAQQWAPGNGLPANVEAALAAALLNEGQFAVAKVKALSVTKIRRDNPLIEVMRGAFSLTPEQADNLFIAAAALD